MNEKEVPRRLEGDFQTVFMSCELDEDRELPYSIVLSDEAEEISAAEKNHKAAERREKEARLQSLNHLGPTRRLCDMTLREVLEEWRDGAVIESRKYEGGLRAIREHDVWNRIMKKKRSPSLLPMKHDTRLKNTLVEKIEEVEKDVGKTDVALSIVEGMRYLEAGGKMPLRQLAIYLDKANSSKRKALMSEGDGKPLKRVDYIPILKKKDRKNRRI